MRAIHRVQSEQVRPTQRRRWRRSADRQDPPATPRPGTAAANAVAVQARQRSSASSGGDGPQSRAITRQKRPSSPAPAGSANSARPAEWTAGPLGWPRLPRPAARTEGVAGEAGVARRPPTSGALLPISTIRPVNVVRAAGSSISLAAGMTGTADNPARRSIASRPSGRASVANHQHPSGIDHQRGRTFRKPDRLNRQARPNRRASQHQQRNPTDWTIRIGGRDQRADPLRGVGKCRYRAYDAVGPPQPRHMKLGRANRIGVAGRSSPEFAVSSTNPSSDGAAERARASAASPSAENRSGPANSISSANTSGCPAAAAETSSAMRWRGHGHGPKRASAARSISTMTTSGAPGGCRDSNGNRRSSARSRSAWRAAPGENAHMASNTTRRISPRRTGRPSRPRIAIDADFCSMANC